MSDWITKNGKEQFRIDKIEILNKNGLEKIDRHLQLKYGLLQTSKGKNEFLNSIKTLKEAPSLSIKE